MSKEIKLNLGCGNNYKPGYVNLDKYNKTVADLIHDVDDLPNESNSIDLIEALQLIEHFDYIHCKYVLGEWFRVLKPSGVLIIETPDLEKTYEKFISGDLDTQKTTLQWIYGIESEGMEHKTGFTFNLLVNLLEEIGFEQIAREKQETYMYEHGIRLKCKKPENYLEKQVIARFRKRLLHDLKINDSLILIPLENWLQKLLQTHNNLKSDMDNCMKHVISKIVICHPKIPLIFIQECIDANICQKTESSSKLDFLNKLIKNEFNKKILTLWSRSKKEPGNLEDQFEKFITNIEKIILDVLNHPEDLEARLKYILELDPSTIEIFDLDLILIKARELFNIGVKLYHEKSFPEAKEALLRSTRLNPDLQNEKILKKIKL